MHPGEPQPPFTRIIVASDDAAAPTPPGTHLVAPGPFLDGRAECPQCGYSLDGLPIDTNTCPECGVRFVVRLLP
jgi:hypothetical protein